MIQSLLIANRGEIACRIIRTARSLGIRTVAVYSDADAKALHVRQADEAVHIGPSPARESYLVGDKIIAAAKATGAEAIHPGYGFLSENAEFAQAVIDAGLVWVGPKPASIEAMGLKDAAKKLMLEAGVPCTPGYLGENQDPAFLASQAAEIGYPVLIKAVAGGGGKGMRLVEQAEDFADALASCQREASASFGNAHVLIEKYILSPRHIEVQVFGDSHGNVVHLFERDCSLQRRHQKVIEEAPAPGMDAATREAVCAAAVRAAKAVNYEGAGTIEFIADGSEGLRADRIWFMEMNTRLQVEHPVTEEITGVDLVEWQLRVASGEPIPLRQDELSVNGWAMEARLYAEDPAKGFLPSIGRLEHLRIHLGLPEYDMPDRRRVRIETGVEQGDTISPFYDPMIAKIVVHACSRAKAIDLLATACNDTQVWPVKTNANFLVRLCEDGGFSGGAMTTGLIAERGESLVAPEPVAAPEIFEAARWLGSAFPAAPIAPAFRLNREAAQTVTVQIDGQAVPVEYSPFMAGLMTQLGGLDAINGHSPLEGDGGSGIVFSRGRALTVSLGVRGTGHHSAHDGDILSPMPGKIIAVEVSEGQAVTKGQKLLTLEAMKMEHTLTAPFDGTVAELSATPGAQVQVEALLARIEAA
ncbi:MAG TPA: acetyl/propionyl/methylcrotonyl-CoA carboxylase subunit alpha [Novosphingobium sp.]|nr:acetyl/propionyl/methylcrotonyl-CoA carboxylase subunit alpha [Novosphingobium sp.]